MFFTIFSRSMPFYYPMVSGYAVTTSSIGEFESEFTILPNTDLINLYSTTWIIMIMITFGDCGSSIGDGRTTSKSAYATYNARLSAKTSQARADY